MEKVTGIGGFFFRSQDPNTLNAWYEKHLGVRRCGETYEEGAWWQQEGPTVFAADPPTQGAGKTTPVWRINFRVRDLDAMVAQLRAAEINVEVEDTVYPNGRFAHLVDPEGNNIELWEPNDAAKVPPTGF
ncbi:MAG: VOC family protein [Planctomycetota bacterium]